MALLSIWSKVSRPGHSSNSSESLSVVRMACVNCESMISWKSPAAFHSRGSRGLPGATGSWAGALPAAMELTCPMRIILAVVQMTVSSHCKAPASFSAWKMDTMSRGVTPSRFRARATSASVAESSMT